MNATSQTTQDLIERCEAVSGLLKALSHPLRLQILCRLVEEPLTVGELTERSGSSQPLVSQFLKRMRDEGLVDGTRDGKFIRYSISDAKVRQLIRSMHRIFCTV